MLDFFANDLVAFEIQEKETHLKVFASGDLADKTLALLFQLHATLETYLIEHPNFKDETTPRPIPFFKIPAIIKNMVWAAKRCHTPPFASRHGSLGELIGKELTKLAREVIVVNGNCCFLKSSFERTLNLPSGLRLKISPREGPLALCAAFNLGEAADLLVVKSSSGALADAAAFALGNALLRGSAYDNVIKMAKNISGLKGCLFMKGTFLGAVGKMEISKITKYQNRNSK
jgi:ApbE superfamily uncharacterized protein (UPF0280 family)